MTKNNKPSNVPSDARRRATLNAELAAMGLPVDPDVPGEQVRGIVRELPVPTHPEVDAGGGNRETWTMGTYNIGPYSGRVRVDIGAGLGDTHLAMLVEIDGDDPDGPPVSYWEYIDVTTLTELWLSRILDQHHAAEQAPDLSTYAGVAQAAAAALAEEQVESGEADRILVLNPAEPLEDYGLVDVDDLRAAIAGDDPQDDDLR